MSEATSEEPVIRYFPEGSEIRWSHCPSGWINLLDRITSALDEHLPGWRLRQVKSDLGTLDFYFDTPDGAAETQRTAVRAVHRAAVQRSSRTCEVCGAPGQPVISDGWLSVLCDEHQVTAGLDVPMVELRVRGTCPRCGHPEASHRTDTRLPSAPRVCLAAAEKETECGCPLTDTLPVDAVGDFEILTSHGSRYFLRLGGHNPRWFRSPGPASVIDYAGRWNRLGSLRNAPIGYPDPSGAIGALRVGRPFTVGIGSFTDLMHASRIVWIRHVLDPADLPPEIQYCHLCNRNPVHDRDGLCVDCQAE